MSYCKEEGKDRIVFLAKEDTQKPSNVTLGDLDEDTPGLINENGEINWGCPCLGGMATGPCGYEFREAFSCFHYSDAQPKGSDCYEQFKDMQTCMSKYPDLYGSGEEEEGENMEALTMEANMGALEDELNDNNSASTETNTEEEKKS